MLAVRFKILILNKISIIDEPDTPAVTQLFQGCIIISYIRQIGIILYRAVLYRKIELTNTFASGRSFAI